eukprot:TRINITY_DN16159_c0_g2_i1.p1 TRINITY_DN16159_c0_g2~~TRINITY_DN16159_c0_g2_i1.p1  ORF type:complete len:3364 (-),score=863.27 TRINITY_DN16159_c0_g2_i1:158-10249(-)
MGNNCTTEDSDKVRAKEADGSEPIGRVNQDAAILTDVETGASCTVSVVGGCAGGNVVKCRPAAGGVDDDDAEKFSKAGLASDDPVYSWQDEASTRPSSSFGGSDESEHGKTVIDLAQAQQEYDALLKRKEAAEADRANLNRLVSQREAEADQRRQKEANSPHAFGQWACATFFMGRKLPAKQSDAADAEVLDTMATFLGSGGGGADALDGRIGKMVLEFCKAHRPQRLGCSVAVPPATSIHQQLKQLAVGELWASWVRAQNAIVLVERLSATLANISAWAVQPPPQDVLRAVPGFMQVPEISTTVPWEKLLEEAFPKLLAELASTAVDSTDKPDAFSVANPCMVVDFLLPAIGGDQADLRLDWQCIGKKVRDESRLAVESAKSSKPWRRAPAWLALKSLLHLACVRCHRGEGRGVYKAFVARLLGEALKKSLGHGFADDSSRVEALRKVSRRLYKMQAAGMCPDTIGAVSDIVRSSMEQVELRWKLTCEDCPYTVVNPATLNFERDITHSLTTCTAALRNIMKGRPRDKSVNLKPPPCQARPSASVKRPYFESIDRLQKLNKNEPEDMVTVLYDVEHLLAAHWAILESGGPLPFSLDEVQQLLPLLNAYLAAAGNLYKGDVEGRSKMVLTAVVIVLLLDRQSCKEHRILAKHAVGLDPTVLEALILPEAKDKKLLLSIERYLESRRQGQVKDHSPILFHQVHENCFAVSFVKQSEKIKGVLNDINLRCQRNQEVKTQEVQKLKAEFEALDAKVREEQCNCQKKMPCWPKDGNRPKSAADAPEVVMWKQIKAICQKCQTKVTAGRIQCDYYERLLPTEPWMQMAVVFELQMPHLLACLRDALFIVAKLCSQAGVGADEQKHIEVLGMWPTYDRLSNWKQRSMQDLKVQMVYSKTTPKVQVHLRAANHISSHDTFIIENQRDLLIADASSKQHHVDASTGLNSFSISRTSLKCVQIQKKELVKPKEWDTMVCLSSECSWCLKRVVNVETKDPRYTSLQFAIESWKHSENDALCRKHFAHGDLSLREFDAVGGLRAGIRLQLPRLARAFAQQSLSLDRHGVLDVLTSVLKQAGPAGSVKGDKEATWRRQAHELLGEQYFCDDLLEHAQSILQQQASNWTRHLLLLALVEVGRCVLQHAENTTKAVAFLKNCRSAACDWIHQVRAALTRSKEKDAFKLRLKIVEITAIASLTYDAAAKALLATDQDAATFVWFRVVLSDNMLLGSGKASKNDSFRANLLRKSLRIALDLEEALYKLAGSGGAALTGFVEMHWSEASSGRFRKWTQLQGSSQRWFQTTFSGTAGESLLQLDVIRGTFLVNGTPLGHLPKSIVMHEEYQGLFTGSVFEVQPALGGGWRTAASSDGVSFTFFQPAKPGDAPVIIEERRGKDGKVVQAQLVSRAHFVGDFPDALVEQYSHWLVRQGKVGSVYFRPRRYDDSKFRQGCTREGADFIMDLDNNLIVDTVLRRQLIDIRSPTFDELFQNIFSRLAPRGEVHVFQSPTSPTSGVVVLPKLKGLQFSVVNGQVRSYEFGSTVAPVQDLGTLIGLKQGLLLQEPTGERTLLLPHAAATRASPTTQAVKLDIASLRHPTLFVYSVREDLRELHGQKDRLAWLYLAKLHALTAAPFADPFLGRTGTAQALQLLRSGRCRGNLDGAGGWACETSDKTLVEIAKCSPLRRYCGDNNSNNVAEIVDFKISKLPAVCAHDGFGWIVSKMRKEVEQQARFAGISQKEVQEDRDLEMLTDNPNRRSYLQTMELYASDCMLTREDEVEIMGPMRAMMSLLPYRVRFEAPFRRPGARAVAEPMHKKRPVGTAADLRGLLLNSQIPTLRGIRGTKWQDQPISKWQQLLGGDEERNWMAQSWMDLYESARLCETEAHICSMAYGLALLSQRDPSATSHLVQLGTIAMFASSFVDSPAPTHWTYAMPSQAAFDPAVLDEVIEGFLEKFEQKARDDADAQERGALEKMRSAHQQECLTTKLAIIASSDSAFKKDGFIDVKACKRPRIGRPGDLASEVNAVFNRWRHARELHKFLAGVMEKLQEVQSTLPPADWVDLMATLQVPDEAQIQPEMFRLPTPQGGPVVPTKKEAEIWQSGIYQPGVLVDLSTPPPAAAAASANSTELPVAAAIEAGRVYSSLMEPLKEGWRLAKACSERHVFMKNLDLRDIDVKIRRYLETVNADLKSVQTRLMESWLPQDAAGQALASSGLWPAAVPAVLLPELLSQAAQSQPFNTLLGALALLMRHQQRAKRCLKLLRNRDMTRLEQELKNAGCGEWQPRSHPEWLLLELDNDFCIREQQALVAKQIMSEEFGNRLLQLIMGAGKTAVIMPMVMASLSSEGRRQRLVRVTVLSPLYGINTADWQLKLGGLLGKRLFPLVCQRDIKIERHSPEVVRMLESMCADGHVLVTTPEHRLSLENKVLELAISGHCDQSLQLRSIVDFLSNCCRDILDESDEILHPKFQLIYTLGRSLQLDGGLLRWSVGAAVLQSAARHADALRKEFGAQAVEVVHRENGDGVQNFPFVRLMDQAQYGAYQRLCELIVEDFLAGKHRTLPVVLRPHEVELWRKAVLEREAPEAAWAQLSAGVLRMTLLLRGLLAHQVLFGALHKRWRVEYGGHPTALRRMAVPYRAKDVAADKTEFGHPDVALLLTTLHYYHQGLSREQLQEAFKRLANRGVLQASAIYSSWTEAVPTLGVQTWAGVNLDDAEQFNDVLHPALHRHMQVIDFWLAQVVFPTEAKQYKQNMVSTAWDLCRSDASCITTGFSGTDDARLLLPLTIKQENMAILTETNGVLLHNLLRKENDDYTALPAGSTGQELLQRVAANSRLDVLLDCGALVLELSNREVAERWLELRKDRKGAIYFEGDRIDVVDRFGVSTPLAVSPFERSMGDCLLYLDDEHTRGSDFKLPVGHRAAVTLGKGLQKDKLTQAVMRMRLLGHGHSVCFLASFEADLQIGCWRSESSDFKGEAAFKATPGRTLGLQHLPAIMSWCLNNTVKSTCDRLVYLAGQGASQIRRRHVCSEYREQPELMAQHCAETDATTLKELYGHSSGQELIPAIVQRHITTMIGTLAGEMQEHTVTTAAKLMAHVNGLVPDVYQSSKLFDEEHERELEEEVEQEMERVQESARPELVSPCIPKLSPGLVEYARTGRRPHADFPTLPDAIVDTSFEHLREGDWDESVRVTQDFIDSVEGYDERDAFLRPVTWMLLARGGPAVLISNFEAEQLAIHFHRREAMKGAVLHMLSPVVRLQQPLALPSLAERVEIPVAIEVFAGSVHGDAAFLRRVRSFLGLCAAQPASPVWRELFGSRGAIAYDGFVLPEFRAELAERLGVELVTPFSKSPLQLMHGLYAARHLSDMLEASSVGQLLGVTSVCN